MASKHDSRKPHADLCAELNEDDGVDPRLTRRRRASREKTNRKTLQLCKQAEVALASALGGDAGDHLLTGLEVIEVLPAPDDRRLRVRLRLPVDTSADADEVRRRLEAARGWLRGEVAAAVTRKRAPQLAFELLPPSPESQELTVDPPREQFDAQPVAEKVCPLPTPTDRTHEPGAAVEKVRAWLVEPLTAEVRQSVERLARADDVEHVVLLPDVHLATGVCVGTVIATIRLIYPQAVGSDLGCGMTTVALDAPESLLDREAAAQAILDAWREAIPIIRHRHREAAPPILEPLADVPLSDPSLVRAAQREGRIEFGTLGRGNHFLELQADADGGLWLLVHSGSRAMGQIITRWHAHRAVRTGGGLMYLDANTDAGNAYLRDAAWAEQYAECNRREILRAATEALARRFRISARWDTLFGASHNHVRREEHLGRAWWVHRKGANSARDGEAAIIPGSMATPTYHVTGRGAEAALCSSSHGAGRAMSRGEARRQISMRRLTQQLQGVWFNERLAAGLCEEAPGAYKNIEAVLRAQSDLVRVVRRLTPRLSFKGV